MATESPPQKKHKAKEVCHCPCCPKFQEWREVLTDGFKLPKGEYYVGDLALVLSDDISSELPDHPGKFTLSNGREVGCFKFEGCQPDRDNDVDFYVESGMIGITLIAGLSKKWQCPRGLFDGWGPHWNKVKALGKTIKSLKLGDFMMIAGVTVVYNEEFECWSSTMSHYKHDDHSTSTFFGDKVSLWTIHGDYDTDEGSESEEEDDEDASETLK